MIQAEDLRVLEQLESAALPEDLRAGLRMLVGGMAEIRPGLTGMLAFRANYMFHNIIREAIDPGVDTYWWEVGFDLLAQSAALPGKALTADAGAPLLAAVAALRPLFAARPGGAGPNAEVTLREITHNTLPGICWLSDTLREPYANFVAPNVFSLAEANFTPHAWVRAVYAGKSAAGFVMLVDDDETPDYFLMRLMVAEPFRGRGVGRQAVARLAEYVRTRPGGRVLRVSCGQGVGSPEGFYRGLGFTLTGEVLDDEIVLALEL